MLEPRPLISTAARCLVATVIKNDRCYESLFGAPPRAGSQGNPARDTNRPK
jgi:hypothetical protein